METTLSDNMQKLTINQPSGAPLLCSYEDITPDFVKTLTNPTDKFLCKISDNWPSLRFGGFKIRDMISGYTLVEVQDEDVDNDNIKDTDDPSTRVIKYHLGPDFLRL